MFSDVGNEVATGNDGAHPPISQVSGGHKNVDALPVLKFLKDYLL